MRWTLAILMLFQIALGANAGDTADVPIKLAVTFSHELTLPGFSFSGNAQCDASGNLYFHSGFDGNDSLVLKLRTDGTSTVVRLPDKEATETYFLAFPVSPDGKLWFLDGGREGNEGIYLFEFDDDPTSPIRTHLDAPEGLNAQNFIVLNNGHVLLQGYFDENAPREQRGRGYLGEFDSSGKLLRKSFGKVSEEVLKDVATRAADAAAGQSEDGMTYLLEPDKVVVISQAGEVVKNLPLRTPAPGYRAYNLYVAGRRLVVGFYLSLIHI